jgi:hypothetical protein
MADLLPNKEWELHELIESLSAELDRFLDTVSLKSNARGITFGLTTMNLELNVFSRYDRLTGKILFRTANPGEEGASVLKLDIPSLIKDQIQTHEDGFAKKPDTRPLKDLGIKSDLIAGLNRLGIFTVDNLKKMSVSDEMRQVIENKTDIKKDAIVKWVKIPSIWRVNIEGNEIIILGENLQSAPDKVVMIEGKIATVTEWETNKIRARVPEGFTSGNIAVMDRTGISETIQFSKDQKIEEVSIERVSGIGDKYSAILREAGIDTDVKLLSQPVEKIAEILKVSMTKASSLFELTARRIYDKRI